MKREHSAERVSRVCECALAVGCLILLLPVLAVCALLVRLSSSGPVFFHQKRVGLGGKTFVLHKFRTMYDLSKGLPITAATDSRITPAGAFLRKFKLDELPQLYNVLRGDMSFVGPRPEVPELVDLSNPAWTKVLSTRPGITDPVTLQLRNEEAFLAKVQDREKFYLEVIQPFKLDGYQKYLDSKCLRTDLKLIGQTAKVVLFPGSAAPIKIEDIRLSLLKQ